MKRDIFTYDETDSSMAKMTESVTYSSRLPLADSQAHELNMLENQLLLLKRLLRPKSRTQSKAAKALEDLNRVLQQEYRPLAQKDDYPDEADMFERLQATMDRAEEMVSFPFLAGRKIIAIGGAFSSGKSTFVNSLLQEEILPTAIQRTTAVPTYIARSTVQTTFAYTKAGRREYLTSRMFQTLTHEFGERLGMSVASMARYLALTSEKMPFTNLAFLDTPGYTGDVDDDPSDKSDIALARESLVGSDALIWCVDVENGDIRENDLQFLESLNFPKEIIIIITKADLKLPSDVMLVETP